MELGTFVAFRWNDNVSPFSTDYMIEPAFHNCFKQTEAEKGNIWRKYGIRSVERLINCITHNDQHFQCFDIISKDSFNELLILTNKYMGCYWRILAIHAVATHSQQ